MLRLPLVAFTALAALSVSGCRHAVPDNVAATVNGRTITHSELDKQYQSSFSTPAAGTSDDQMHIQKLEVLRSLVDREIMLQRYAGGGDDNKEAVGAQPGKVTLQVVVQASFTLK